ncbi:MAG: response regulator [Saprospiraceae bacterium]|jgi:CheY-like chemotaxis protein|nr:response regulator [Saprospiraceae bacterium]
MKQGDLVFQILMVDDDEDDRFLTQTAFEESDLKCKLDFVKDGTEAIDHLTAIFETNDDRNPLPNLILLDLNMPKKNGWQVLAEVKNSESLRHIPVLVFTTSKSPEHVKRSYDLGANSFITKPSTYSGLLDIVRVIGKYWKDVATVI